jgi:hypothetical protein
VELFDTRFKRRTHSGLAQSAGHAINFVSTIRFVGTDEKVLLDTSSLTSAAKLFIKEVHILFIHPV